MPSPLLRLRRRRARRAPSPRRGPRRPRPPRPPARGTAGRSPRRRRSRGGLGRRAQKNNWRKRREQRRHRRRSLSSAGASPILEEEEQPLPSLVLLLWSPSLRRERERGRESPCCSAGTRRRAKLPSREGGERKETRKSTSFLFRRQTRESFELFRSSRLSIRKKGKKNTQLLLLCLPFPFSSLFSNQKWPPPQPRAPRPRRRPSSACSWSLVRDLTRELGGKKQKGAD